MKFPIVKSDFDGFIEESHIFKLTKVAMNVYLEHWYRESQEVFVDNMRANLDAVMKTYHFYNSGVSISRDYSDIYLEPLDYITCRIRITDEEDDICGTYTAYFDEQLNIFDDKIS